MATEANPTGGGRAAALARRRALSSGGKTSRSSAPSGVAAPPRPAPAPALAPAPAPAPRVVAGTPPTPASSGRTLAQARRAALAEQGRRALRGADRVRTAPAAAPTPAAAAPVGSGQCTCGCKGAHREAGQGDSAAAVAPPAWSASPRNPLAQRDRRAEAALAAKPSGRLLSQTHRAALATRGGAAANTPRSVASLARQTDPTLSGRELARQVRARRASNGGQGLLRGRPQGRPRPARAPIDQAWKVGVSETASGQLVTGTPVGRGNRTTGDEPGTCQLVTGTEYLAAEIFRDFCQAEPPSTPPKVHETRTAGGQRLSGSLPGRPARVTGDEQGAGVVPTGTPYTAPAEIGAPLPNGQAREPRAPVKVGTSATLSGSTVTGTLLGRSALVTGDEPGSCRLVTGDEYLDRDHQEGCGLEPRPRANRVGVSLTPRGQTVSGTQAGRSARVTGDEPGTCKNVTGTPYRGLEEAEAFCADDAPASRRAARPRPSGPLNATRRSAAVTGTAWDSGGIITGPFGLGAGKITGTEQFRASARVAPEPAPAAEADEEAPPAPRITGEGQSAGIRITGDDWERGERVTGTEGAWARRRNPSRSGPTRPEPMLPRKRNEDTPPPVSRVTGSAGNTGRGSLITYSGGARG